MCVCEFKWWKTHKLTGQNQKNKLKKPLIILYFPLFFSLNPYFNLKCASYFWIKIWDIAAFVEWNGNSIKLTHTSAIDDFNVSFYFQFLQKKTKKNIILVTGIESLVKIIFFSVTASNSEHLATKRKKKSSFFEVWEEKMFWKFFKSHFFFNIFKLLL